MSQNKHSTVDCHRLQLQVSACCKPWLLIYGLRWRRNPRSDPHVISNTSVRYQYLTGREPLSELLPVKVLAYQKGVNEGSEYIHYISCRRHQLSV